MIIFTPDIKTNARKSQNCTFFINECENYLATPGTLQNLKWISILIHIYY